MHTEDKATSLGLCFSICEMGPQDEFGWTLQTSAGSNPTIYPRPSEGNDLRSVAQQLSDCSEVRAQTPSGHLGQGLLGILEY